MSEAMIPKNGLPCFDATGNVSMVPRTDLQSNLGFVCKQISYTEPAGGGFGIILLSDIGGWPVSSGFLPHGFAGLVQKHNTGHIYGGFGMGLVNAVACYTVTANGVCLNSTQQYIIPVVAKYNGHCYVGIKVFGNTGQVYLTGNGYNLLDSPIVLNDRNGMNKADAEILFEAEASAVGGLNRYFSINYATLQKGGLRNGRKCEAYQHLPQGVTDGLNGLSWRMSGSRYRHVTWYLHDNGRNSMPVATGRKRLLAICHTGGTETYQCHFSAAHDSERSVFPGREDRRHSDLGQLEIYDRIRKEVAA